MFGRKFKFHSKLRKNSDSGRVREGHEFHSCRNWREMSGGFQPLGECPAGKTLFPQSDKLPLLICVALIALATLAAPPLAFSQSCALCYTQAASAGVRMIQALRSGILVLIVPPTFMSVCMIFIVHRKRNQFRQEDDAPVSDRDW